MVLAFFCVFLFNFFVCLAKFLFFCFSCLLTIIQVVMFLLSVACLIIVYCAFLCLHLYEDKSLFAFFGCGLFGFFYSFCSLIFHCLFSCRFFGNHKLPFHTDFYSCFPFLRCPLACINFAFYCASRSVFFL